MSTNFFRISTLTILKNEHRFLGDFGRSCDHLISKNQVVYSSLDSTCVRCGTAAQVTDDVYETFVKQVYFAEMWISYFTNQKNY